MKKINRKKTWSILLGDITEADDRPDSCFFNFLCNIDEDGWEFADNDKQWDNDTGFVGLMSIFKESPIVKMPHINLAAKIKFTSEKPRKRMVSKSNQRRTDSWNSIF